MAWIHGANRRSRQCIVLAARLKRTRRYRQLGEPNHISEITPWLRKSVMHKHLAELPAETVAQSHATPKAGDGDPRLHEIVWSAERILQKSYDFVPDLLHVDARVLNTFQAGTITQDPFQKTTARGVRKIVTRWSV
ncbi:hypothetical protein LTR47_011548 [Exophiala xenobiotica]|nr:hypothetical protein LTR92_011240 [Exophiala xenobiotica]KAK5219307.1 hypothetical protein LTR47_011548 [Exophiala xenobiotica]KAK5432327.1 hypothetical protein LTR18_011162 [Exophiala xenobiotica]